MYSVKKNIVLLKNIYIYIYTLFTFIYLLVHLKLHIEGLYVIDIDQLNNKILFVGSC